MMVNKALEKHMPITKDVDPLQSSTKQALRKPAGFLRRFFRFKLGILGLMFVTLITIMALFTPWIARGRDPLFMYPEFLSAPSWKHPFGTDSIGRDIFARVVYGSRSSLSIAVSSGILALFFGLIIGMISGYAGGNVDRITVFFLDIMFAFPPMLLAMGVVAAIGPAKYNVILTIGAVYIPRIARLSRGMVLTVKQNEYIKACRALGMRSRRTLVRHILPNIMSPIIVQTTLNVSMAVIMEAALSFLGLGTQPPEPSWGHMLSESRQYIELSPYAAIFSAMAISMAILGFNLLGDGIRDALDPSIKR